MKIAVALMEEQIDVRQALDFQTECSLGKHTAASGLFLRVRRLLFLLFRSVSLFLVYGVASVVACASGNTARPHVPPGGNNFVQPSKVGVCLSSVDHSVLLFSVLPLFAFRGWSHPPHRTAPPYHTNNSGTRAACSSTRYRHARAPSSSSAAVRLFFF